jgi:hypothetical protein
MRLVPPDSYQIKDETSGPNAPDLEFLVVPLAYALPRRPIPFSGDMMTINTILLRCMSFLGQPRAGFSTMCRPQSTGTITLQSNDPFDPPVIDPKSVSCKTHIDEAHVLNMLDI